VSLRSVKKPGRASVAVVGAPTDDGAHVREALAEYGVPGSRVDLYASVGEEVLLSEYAGEARMIQQPDLDEIVGHDVIFLCEPGELSTSVYERADDGAVLIDMLDCLPAGAAENGNGGAQCFRVAHPLALLLEEVLGPLEEELGLEEAVALVIRPASDFGQDGVEELREQTIRLLNFAEVPKEIFGRQLAFNLIPGGAGSGGDLEGRIRGEVARALGWQESHLAVSFLTAPLFHGHGVQLRLRFKDEPGVDRIRETLTDAGLDAAGGETTPLDVIGQVRTSLSGLTEDGLGAYWLWAVAGETSTRSAREAVRLAARVGEL
jgi:aspartate-semialdehyde dehydrogenase